MEKIDCLRLNAHLKYIEFVSYAMGNYEDNVSILTIKEKFKDFFKCDMPLLLDQNFGVIRLIPLMFICEDGRFSPDDREKLIVIRNAFAHNDIFSDENGYTFKANRPEREDVSMSYSDFNEFLHRVENNSYLNHLKPY